MTSASEIKRIMKQLGKKGHEIEFLNVITLGKISDVLTDAKLDAMSQLEHIRHIMQVSTLLTIEMAKLK